MSVRVVDPARFVIETNTASEASTLLTQLSNGAQRPDLDSVDPDTLDGVRKALRTSKNGVDITVLSPGLDERHEFILTDMLCVRMSSAEGRGAQLEALPLALLVMQIARLTRWRPGVYSGVAQDRPAPQIPRFFDVGTETDAAAEVRRILLDSYSEDDIDWTVLALRRRSTETDRDEVCRVLMIDGRWGIDQPTVDDGMTSRDAWRAFISPLASSRSRQGELTGEE